MALLGAAPATAQWTPFSTFDHTTTAGSPLDLREAWADAKAPGNGSVYVTGSIEVQNTQNNPTYSNVGASVALGLPTFDTTMSGGFRRQVAIIQQSAANGGGIQQQVYFYGLYPNGNPELPGLHTNVRAISVWPGATEGTTRIAICGETSDNLLPRSQNPNATPSTPGNPVYSGFIAVFDGGMALLWTHHVVGAFRSGQGLEHCAVTDVSIRVVEGVDVVTYCGISSHGVDLDPVTQLPTAANASLTPVNWFTWAAPLGRADGAADNGFGQWDGFVGRLVNPGSVVGGQAVDFHSVVGGLDQDGLFGLAELPDDRFVTVGSTASPVNAGGGVLAFPFTLPNQPAFGVYCMGTTLVFDPLAALANDRLEAAISIGQGANQGVASVARDVMVHLDGVQGDLGANPMVPPLHAIHVVGSTNDPMMFPSIVTNPAVTPQAMLNTTGVGPATDGFVLSAADTPGSVFVPFQKGTYHGGVDDDALHGVAGWNEHRDHVTVFGRTEGIGAPLADVDLEVCNYFFDTPNGSVGVVADPTVLRRTSVLATLDQVPTAMGFFHVLGGVPPAWDFHDLGSPAGGGVAVEERGRITIVGQSDAMSSYPSLPGPPQSRFGRGSEDGVRTDIDLVPVGPMANNGVGRTDGTGLNVPIVAGADGGTTPVASRSPFGWQVGMPAPALQRINLDFEGDLPDPFAASSPASVLVDRPPFGAPIVAAFLHYGIPATPMAPFPDPTASGIEWWMDPNSVFTTSISQFGGAGFDQTVRFPLTFPTGNNIYVIQAICMLANGTFCGSPGMVVNY
ncbi:MAG: hypothetical protein KDE27_23115 [Planctomycetes bacterium]|nr:hypothetical protein [Planctomycetota bacterium]